MVLIDNAENCFCCLIFFHNQDYLIKITKEHLFEIDLLYFICKIINPSLTVTFDKFNATLL